MEKGTSVYCGGETELFRSGRSVLRLRLRDPRVGTVQDDGQFALAEPRRLHRGCRISAFSEAGTRLADWLRPTYGARLSLSACGRWLACQPPWGGIPDEVRVFDLSRNCFVPSQKATPLVARMSAVSSLGWSVCLRAPDGSADVVTPNWHPEPSASASSASASLSAWG